MVGLPTRLQWAPAVQTRDCCEVRRTRAPAGTAVSDQAAFVIADTRETSAVH
jgi:hypothetical protein